MLGVPPAPALTSLRSRPGPAEQVHGPHLLRGPAPLAAIYRECDSDFEVNWQMAPDSLCDGNSRACKITPTD